MLKTLVPMWMPLAILYVCISPSVKHADMMFYNEFMYYCNPVSDIAISIFHCS